MTKGANRKKVIRTRGYGSLALGFSAGNVAAGVPSVYKNGAGCRACFQGANVSSEEGTTVILTDMTKDNGTDFVLSGRAFAGMTNPGMSQRLPRLSIQESVGRVLCVHKNQNLAIRVEESSQKTHYLAIKVLYQGGQTEIVAIDAAPVNTRRGTAVQLGELSRSRRGVVLLEMMRGDGK